MYLHISTIVSFIVFYKHKAYSTYPFDLVQTKCKILRDWYSYLQNDVLDSSMILDFFFRFA